MGALLGARATSESEGVSGCWICKPRTFSVLAQHSSIAELRSVYMTTRVFQDEIYIVHIAIVGVRPILGR